MAPELRAVVTRRPGDTGRARGVRLGELGALVATLSCASPAPTQIVVVVDADAALRGLVTEVELSAARAGDGSAYTERVSLPPAAFPLSFGLTHGSGPLGPIDVTITARDRGGQLVLLRVARTRFEPGAIRVLRLDLYGACRDACPQGQSCGATGCLSPEQAGSLEPWTGRVESLPPLVAGLLPQGGAGGTGAGGGMGGTSGAGMSGTGGGMSGTGGGMNGTGGTDTGGSGGAGTGGSGGGTGGTGGGTGGTGGGAGMGGTSGTAMGGTGGTAMGGTGMGGTGGTAMGGTGMGGTGGGTMGGCALEARRVTAACPYPQGWWNQRLTTDDIRSPNSDLYMATLEAASRFLVPEFGGDPDQGFPWVAVPTNEPTFPVLNISGVGLSSAPWPADTPVRAHLSRHVVVLQHESCFVYEGWDCLFETTRWRCRSSRAYKLGSGYNQPLSGNPGADPSGVDIYPLLIKRWEVEVGEVNHVLRMTIPATRNQRVWPATAAYSTDPSPSLPPMGARLRLRPDIVIPAQLSQGARAVLTALRTHGAVVAAHGTAFTLAAESHCDWEPALLAELAAIPASWLEFIGSY